MAQMRAAHERDTCQKVSRHTGSTPERRNLGLTPMSTNTRGREKPTDSTAQIEQIQTPYCGPDESVFYTGESVHAGFDTGRWIVTDHTVEVKE